MIGATPDAVAAEYERRVRVYPPAKVDPLDRRDYVGIIAVDNRAASAEWSDEMMAGHLAALEWWLRDTYTE